MTDAQVTEIVVVSMFVLFMLFDWFADWIRRG